jgi:hypothetical protein
MRRTGTNEAQFIGGWDAHAQKYASNHSKTTLSLCVIVVPFAHGLLLYQYAVIHQYRRGKYQPHSRSRVPFVSASIPDYTSDGTVELKLCS